MRTIRGRLAAGYAVLLGVTIVVFAGVTYLLQGSGRFGDLDARVQLESDLISGILGEAYRARDSVIVAPDPATGDLALTPDVRSLLEGVPGLVIVLGRERRVLWLSSDARDLPFSVYQGLIDFAESSVGSHRAASGDIGGSVGRVRYFVRPVTVAGDEITAVVSAVPSSGFVPLLTAMLWTAPFVIAASLLVTLWLGDRSLRPMADIIDEIEAITDGRSLHKRLGGPEGYEELVRLTVTLNQMLARLERSFSTLRRFTADASHELKTPLTVLRAGIERSITHPRVPDDVMATLEETLFEVNRMAELVDSLLTLARVDEGRAPLQLETLDLRDLLAEVAETASILGEQANVDVEVVVPEEPCPFRGDHGRMRQLLMNLLTNAIKYTPPEGRVTIRASRRDGSLIVTVSDTGIGIAPGDLPYIFDRFWRADPARSRTGDRPGAGLGLAISRWIAEAHGGAIEVQSRPGRGTTFTITIPADHPPA
jgi:two-component system OmpR family sensor kinase